MSAFGFEDFVSDLVYQVQDKVVPTLEQVTREAKKQLRKPRPPPKSTDLLYLTDRLIVSSKPALAWPNPAYTDVGREEGLQRRETSKSAPSPVDTSKANGLDASKGTGHEMDGEASAIHDDSVACSKSLAQPYESHEQLPTKADEPLKQVPETPSTGDSESNFGLVDAQGRNSSPSTGLSLFTTLRENPQDGTAAGIEAFTSEPSNNNVNNPQQESLVGDSANFSNEAVSNQSSPQLSPTILPSGKDEGEEKKESLAEASATAFIKTKDDNLEGFKSDFSPLRKSSIPMSTTTTETTSTPTSEESGQDTQTSEPDMLTQPIELQTADLAAAVNKGSFNVKEEGQNGTEISTKLDNGSFSATTTEVKKDSQDVIIVDDDENDVGIKMEVSGVQNKSAKEPQHAKSPLPSAIFNSPATITSYLDKRHGRGHYIAYSLTDDRPDDRTLLLFRRQIIQMGWWSPCIGRSETPSISKLLDICYAIHAYLQLDPSHVALLYCANGKTRTAIVAACYLKFAGLVQRSEEGFLHFLTKRGIVNPLATWKQLPPSLKLFFQQFDTTLDLGGSINRKPLLLRAIALQGIPVEDKPCLDIWNSSQEHIYSSHPEMWDETLSAQRRQPKNNVLPKRQSQLSQWADEEGFYKVNIVLDGDFLLLCRFGGDFASETTIHDPSKILFRYANTTGFLSGGYPYELSSDRVDLSRLYASHLDEEDFLVTLLFEADWEKFGDENCSAMIEGFVKGNSNQAEHLSNVGGQAHRCYEPEACEEGWKIIVQHHSARPEKSDIAAFRQLYFGEQNFDKCKDHLICVALQLSNFDYKRAEQILLNSPSFSWWQEKVQPTKEKLIACANAQSQQSTEETCNEVTGSTANEILKILDEVNVASSLSLPRLDRTPPTVQMTTMDAGNSESFVKSNLSDESETLLESTGWMVSSLMYPRKGDVIGSPTLGKQLVHTLPPSEIRPPSIASKNRPRLPYFSMEKATLLPLSSGKLRHRDPPSKEGKMGVEFPLYDWQREITTQLHMELKHTGMSLPAMIELLEDSQKWIGRPLLDIASEAEVDVEGPEIPEMKPAVSREATMNREAKEQKEKEWEDAKKAEAHQKEKMTTEETLKKEEDTTEKENEKTEDAGDKDPDDEVPLKDDPEYAKYFKMLKMGMSREQVCHAMTRDEKDPKILELDPNKSLESQMLQTNDDVPLKDDPEYEKYFKMLKMGLPMGAVKNALTRDGKDPSVMDLDPNQSLVSQTQAGTEEGNEPILRDDPEYAKYFKMLKMGLPLGAVKNALTKDGKDPGIIDFDPEKSLKSQIGGTIDEGPPLKDDPDYAKYFKMLSMGLPLGAVKNALTRDGKDPSIMDLDPNKSVKSQTGGGSSDEDSGPALKDDPEYSKYFKMLSMGLPVGAVKNALSRDGKDPGIMDLDPNKSLKSQMGEVEEKDTGIPLKDDPEYSKYFKMLNMGLPAGAVKNALERDGKNPAILDMNLDKSVAFQLKKKGSANKKPAKKKKRVRRKKIYWNPIDPTKLKEDSMWNLVRGEIVMDKLNYDVKEFEDLFTESADPSDKKKNKKETKKEAKKLVQVIDPKRSMNGGIVLSRLKTEHSKIAEFVNRMEYGKFDSTQLKALKEYLADADERRGLIAYMKKGESSQDVHDKLFADCSETEKYMVTMLHVSDAGPKLDAMMFRTVFKNRLEETTDSIQTLNCACDELRSSQKFRKLMAIILTVVNQINTGGEGKMAMGFTLDALLKLNEAKAFDKKTSVLHYVVKVVKKNDDSLLVFNSDLASVTPAESVLLDALITEVKTLASDLGSVHKTVKEEAERMEKAGELRPMSLADLAEQKTAVQTVGGISQFNKIDHLTGRTSMERFTVNARVACDQAIESIENVKKKYAAVLEYFGEDEQMSTGDFFGILRRFMVEWKKATEQVEAIERKEAKERKRAKAKAAKAAAKASGKKKAKAGSSSRKPSRAKPTSSSGDNMEQLGERKARSKGLGGIAAMAAAAASSRNSSRDESSNNITKSATSNEGVNKHSSDFHQNQLGLIKERRSWESNYPNSKSSQQLVRKSWELSHNEKAGMLSSGTLSHGTKDKFSRGPKENSATMRSNTNGYAEAARLKIENEKPDSKSNFASKAAAYRRKKEKKDDSEDGKSKFLSSAAAYRKKKSQKDLDPLQRVDPSKKRNDTDKVSAQGLSVATMAGSNSIGGEQEQVNDNLEIEERHFIDVANANTKEGLTPVFNESKQNEDVKNAIGAATIAANQNTELAREISNPKSERILSDFDSLNTIPPAGPEEGKDMASDNYVPVAETYENGGEKTIERGPAKVVATHVDTSKSNHPIEITEHLEQDPPEAVKDRVDSTELEGSVLNPATGSNDDNLSVNPESSRTPIELIHQEFSESSPASETAKESTLEKGTIGVDSVRINQAYEEETSIAVDSKIDSTQVDRVKSNSSTEPPDYVDDENREDSIGETGANERERFMDSMYPLKGGAEEGIHAFQKDVIFSNQESILLSSDISASVAQNMAQLQALDSAVQEGASGSFLMNKTTSQNTSPTRNEVKSDISGDHDIFHEAHDSFDDVGRMQVLARPESVSHPRGPNSIVSKSETPLHVRIATSSATPTNESNEKLTNVDGGLRRLPQRGVISFISKEVDHSLETFFDATAPDRRGNDGLPSEFDDFSVASSVAIMAGNLQRRNLDARMSESWMQGDTIQNFMGWADQAIKASDTESVRNLEVSRDLIDGNDFDDESTIATYADESTVATYQDDASVVSWNTLNTPSRSSSFAFDTVDSNFDAKPPLEVTTKPVVTPAKVAASILFNDSPINSVEQASEAADYHGVQGQDSVDLGLTFQTNDFGLDTGLTFAVEDAGFDDGLGFGGNGLAFGNADAYNDFGGNSSNIGEKRQREDKSPERKRWFRWGK